jgi:hypothetical protein
MTLLYAGSFNCEICSLKAGNNDTQQSCHSRTASTFRINLLFRNYPVHSPTWAFLSSHWIGNLWNCVIKFRVSFFSHNFNPSFVLRHLQLWNKYNDYFLVWLNMLLYLHGTRALDEIYKERRGNNLRTNDHCVSLMLFFIIEKGKTTKEISISKDWISPLASNDPYRVVPHR